jgi:hypothetical protein
MATLAGILGSQAAQSWIDYYNSIYKNAVITDSKLSYLLELDEGKAKGFKMLGYENKDNLKIILKNQLDYINEAQITTTEYGTKYTITKEIIGLNGQKGLITTVWQIDYGSNEIRLITSIPQPFK